MIRTIAGAAAALAVALGPAAAAQGAGNHTTRLVLSYLADAGYAVAVKLHCDPARGGHPKPAQACATLQKVGGRPGRIRAADTMCTMLYAPVTAQITGTWRGHEIAWTQSYGNTCEMNRATGVLFQF